MWRLGVVVGLWCALVVAVPAGARGVKTGCREACNLRNVPGSCAWLAPRPRQCTLHAVRACVKGARQSGIVECRPPADLPGCQTNHACPFGALCVDGACQVVACGSAPNATTCAASTACQGDKCVVADCGAITANCPSGFHCTPAEGPLGSISGHCDADAPGIHYCATNTDCIIPGEFNLVCRRGECEPRGRRRRRRPSTTMTTTTTSSTTTTTGGGGQPCFDLFDCPAANVCCAGNCRPDPFAGQGICSTLYTPDCVLCANDDDCTCNGIFCDVCEGTASLSGCVDPCG